MTSLWWSCKTCGHESYDSPSALHHTVDAGHEGHALVTTDCGAGPGSSQEAREAAKQATAEAVRSAKVKGGRL